MAVVAQVVPRLVVQQLLDQQTLAVAEAAEVAILSVS
jgi:hypothetical protein